MANDELSGAIVPTLFIGLGGTGKEVLLRLRRKFYERFGTPGFPCIRYLWLDTDTRNVMARGEKIDEIYKAVAFDGSREQIPLLEGKVGSDLMGYLMDKEGNPHIHSWLYTEEVRKFGLEIGDGAGGVRQVGRLTFFRHFSTISGHIAGLLGKDELRQGKSITETQRLLPGAKFSEDIQAQVFLVFSVAGGTGCGIFLDVVYFLRQLQIQKDPSAPDRIIGAVFLPNIYYSRADQDEVSVRSYGNAYAALKELEYLTLRRRGDADLTIDYPQEWIKGKSGKVQGPPFTAMYITEGINEASVGFDRKELFQMVAESLFLDFIPGAFSEAKRSDYSNVASYLSGEHYYDFPVKGIALSQNFARRYASFGMAKLEVPEDLLRRACAAQLAADILKNWNRDPSGRDFRGTVERDVEEERFNVEGITSRFEGLSGWKKIIREGVEGLFMRFQSRSLKEPRSLAELEEEVRKLEKDLTGEDPVREGRVITLLKQSREAVLKECCIGLDKWVQTCLEVPERGLRGFLEKEGYLDQLIGELKDLLSSIENRRQECQDDVDEYGSRKDQKLQELREAQKSLAVAGLGLRDWSIAELLKEGRENLEQELLAQGEMFVLQEAKKVVVGMDSYLQWKKDFEKFARELPGWARDLEKKRGDLLSFGENEVFIRVYNDARDWGAFYSIGRDEIGKPLQPDGQVEQKSFLQEYLAAKEEKDQTLLNLIEAYLQQGRDLIGPLEQYCENRFRQDFRAHPRQIEVLRHFEVENDLDKFAQRLVRNSLPMTYRQDQLGGKTVGGRQTVYLGIAQQAGKTYSDFIEAVHKHLPKKFILKDEDVFQTGRPTEVYLYTVTYAFPLPSLPTISNQCHDAYYSFYRATNIKDKKNYIPLHNDRRWEGQFEDLIVLSEERRQQIKASLEIMILGPILKIIEIVGQNGGVKYCYRVWAPQRSRVENLGRNKREAVQKLQEDGLLREEIYGVMKERESTLSKPLLQSYYWILSYIRFSELLPEETPEYSLILERQTNVHKKLIANGVDSSDLAIEKSLDPKEEAKKKIEGRAEWAGEFPVLKGLPLWERGARESFLLG